MLSLPISDRSLAIMRPMESSNGPSGIRGGCDRTTVHRQSSGCQSDDAEYARWTK